MSELFSSSSSRLSFLLLSFFPHDPEYSSSFLLFVFWYDRNRTWEENKRTMLARPQAYGSQRFLHACVTDPRLLC